MNMRTASRSVLNALVFGAFAIVAGCGDDPIAPNPTIPAEMQGTWQATSFVITPVADPASGGDMIALGGAMQLAVSADGELVTTTTEPGGGGTSVDVGTIRVVSASEVEVQTDPGSPVVRFQFSISGGEWRLTGRAQVELGPVPSQLADIAATYVRR